MKRTIPNVYKSKVYKDFIKELSKPPTAKIMAVTEGDKEKAKLMQEIINHQFKTNQDNIVMKYFRILRMVQKEFIRSQIYGTKMRMDSISKAIKVFTGLPTL